MTKDAISDDKEAIRWRIFQQTRNSFTDISPDQLQKMIDEAVDDIRAKRYRNQAKRP